MLSQEKNQVKEIIALSYCKIFKENMGLKLEFLIIQESQKRDKEMMTKLKNYSKLPQNSQSPNKSKIIRAKIFQRNKFLTKKLTAFSLIIIWESLRQVNTGSKIKIMKLMTIRLSNTFKRHFSMQKLLMRKFTR